MIAALLLFTGLDGSSPRVWGTFKTPMAVMTAATVHPHVCGEHARFFAEHAEDFRFIPTCVGNIAEKRLRNA